MDKLEPSWNHSERRKKGLQEKRVINLSKHCIIPGFVTNGIMTSGGPAMFLSRNPTALPPLLKLFENGNLSNNVRRRTNKLKDIKVCKVIVENRRNPNDAKKLLPKWLNEGTMRPNLQEVLKRNTSSKGILQFDIYLMCNAAEATEILQPSSQSISRLLLLARFTNDFVNIPIFVRRATEPLRTMHHNNSSLQKTSSSFLSTVVRIYDGIKVKLVKSERLSSFVTLLLALMVTATSWKFMVVKPKQTNL